MKGFKKCLSILLAIVFVFGSAPTASWLGLQNWVSEIVLTATAANYSGTCGADGSNLTWQLNTSTGVLTISGTGEMLNFTTAEADTSRPGILGEESQEEEPPESDLSPHTPWWSNRNSITTVIVNSGVTGIGAYAFYGLENASSFTISNSVEQVGANAFQHTAYYQNANNWTNDVLYINSILVEAKTDISGNYNILSGTKTIADYAFSACMSLTSVFIPNSVTSVGDYAFAWCYGLTSVTISDSVTVIPRSMFECCSSLRSVTIPNGVTQIASGAFSDCSNLSNITIPTSVSDVSNSAFDDTAVYQNGWDGDVCYVGNWVVDSKGSLTGAYVVKSGTIGIAAYSFSYRNALTSVSLPDSLLYICRGAFVSCFGITGLSVPATTAEIGTDAFYGIGNVIYEGSATGSPWGARAIHGYVDGYLVYKDSTKRELLACSTSAQGSISIPYGVSRIGVYAFRECRRITGVSIPNSVIAMGEGAFIYCAGLSSVSLPSSLTEIPVAMFYHCTGLSEVFIPKSIQTVGSWAFSDCPNLKDLYYSGTESEWNNQLADQVRFSDEIIDALDATVHFNYSIDEQRPWCSISSTNNVASSQTATLTLSDNVGVAGYYWGTSSNYASNTFTATSSSSVTKTVSAAGTYYLTVKDTSGNLSDTVSITYFTTTLNANGGSVSPTSVLTQSGKSFILPTPTRSGSYTFSNWNTSSGGSGTAYTGNYTVNSSRTLYAQWSIDTHSVTYNYSYNGGTSATKTSATVAEGTAIDLTPTATKAGWTFVGWNTNQNATTGLTSLTMGTSDVTLYAIYKKTLTATFIDYSGTTKKTTTKTVDIYNKATSGTVTAPTQNTYTGWTSRGWSTGTAADASAVNSFEIIGNTTYYGLYQRTLTLSYNANGGSSTPSSQTETQYANSYDISATSNPTLTLAGAITRSGYTFINWAAGSESGPTFDAGESVWISQNITMYAIWDPILPVTHTVTYNYSVNGGTSATKTSASVAEGAAIDLTPTATKSGWTFVGWNTNQNATSALSSLSMGSSNVTLYAIYKKTLTATFIDYSGTTKKTTTKTVDIFNKATSGTVSAPTQNTYTGWTSRGWSTGTAADTGTTSNFTISNNTTYYGLYQRTLTLSYNANGGSSTPSSQTGTQYANSYAISTYKNPSFTLANAIGKSGATFGGWAMGSTSGTKYNAGASVSISANTTMYASWDVVLHTVTYNYSYNGGSSATKTSASVAEGAVIDLNPTATKSGWTFVGWNTNQNATSALSSLSMGSSNVTLYAIYKKTLTATFIDYSGTTKKTRTNTVDMFNTETSAVVTAPTQNTYTGWTSRGWTFSTDADAEPGTAYRISQDYTFYGLYQRTLTLSYNANGGSSTPSSQTGTQYANSYAISTYKNPSFTLANAISKSGSTFNGWARDSVSGTKYNAGASVTISANTTMYASWGSPVTIKVKVVDNKSKAASGATVVVYDSSENIIQTLSTDSSGICTINSSLLKNAETITAYKDIYEEKGKSNRAAAREKFNNVIYSLRITSDNITSSGKWNRTSIGKDSDSLTLKMTSPKLVFNCSVSYYRDNQTGEYYSDIQKAFRYVNQCLQKATDGYAELGKVAVFSTTDKNAFYQKNSTAAKCDIQIRQYISESWGSDVWPNATPQGAYNDWFYDDYCRIQMQKISVNSSCDISTNPEGWAKIVVHEMGHYFFGLLDEYYNGSGLTWKEVGGRPVGAPGNYGLMENQYSDLEMSVPKDYVYASSDEDRFKTDQYFKNGMSCWEYFDKVFFSPHGLHASLPEEDRKYEEIINTVTFYDCRSSLKANASRAAAQDTKDTDGFVMALFKEGNLFLKTEEEITNCTLSDFGNESIDVIQLNRVENGYQTSLTDLDENKRLLTVESQTGINTFDLYNAHVSIGQGFSNRNNSIMIKSDSEQDCRVIIHNSPNKEFQNSLGRVVALKVDEGSRLSLIGRAGLEGKIDYSSLSWYKLENDEWIKFESETFVGEYSCLETRCSVTESGVYALVAAPKTESAPALPSEQSFFTTNTMSSTDGGFRINFNYQNENIIGYKVFCESKDQSETISTFSWNQELIISADHPKQEYTVNVWAILKNGSEVSLGKAQSVISGEYYQQGSSVPYWWVVKYNLQKNGDEIVDNLDNDNDGYTNLQEYRNGTNPTVSDRVPTPTSVSVSDLTIDYKSTAQLNPTITADAGVKITVKYESANPNVAKVDENGTVTGMKRGSTTITCTVTDGNGNTVKDTCKVTVKYTLIQWIIIILLFGWLWY